MPDPTDPRFAEELVRVNATSAMRPYAISGSFKALIREFRPVLANRVMADSTRASWSYYLQLIEDKAGDRLIA